MQLFIWDFSFNGIEQQIYLIWYYKIKHIQLGKRQPQPHH